MCKFEVNVFNVRFSNAFSLPLTSFEMITSSDVHMPHILTTTNNPYIQYPEHLIFDTDPISNKCMYLFYIFLNGFASRDDIMSMSSISKLNKI